MWYLQSVTGYLGLALVFMGNSALQEMFNCYFFGLFASISKIFILAGDWALGYHSMEFRHFPNIS